MIGSPIWVLVDAHNLDAGKFRGMGHWGWFIGSLLLWIGFFPAYLIKRGGIKQMQLNGNSVKRA